MERTKGRSSGIQTEGESRRTTPWQGWEYCVLADGKTAEKTARLLGRSVAEVRQRDVTWKSWYGRLRREHRCFDSPRSPGRLLRLADTICREDYPELFRDEGWERYAYEVLEQALRRFNPDRGRQEIPARERFVRCFRYWFKQRLKRRSRRVRRRRGRPLTDYTQPPRVEAGIAEDYEWWSRLLFRLALARLDHRARLCIDLRSRGESVGEIARRVGIAPKSVSNTYSESRVVALVRAAVRELVLGLPDVSFLAVVRHLLLEVGLPFALVSQLLCVPPDDLGRRLASARGGRPRGMEPEEVVRLLDGLRRTA